MPGSPLLERERERGVLAGAVRAATTGRGGVVVVEGPAGIGKTRLLAEVRELAAGAGARLLTARGSEMEAQFGFGVVRQLLEPVVDALDRAGRARAFAGAAAPAERVFTADDPAASPPAGAELAVLHGLFWLTAHVAEPAAVLTVDDLHWADASSLRYLAHLVPRLEDLPLLVVASVRAGAGSAPAADPPLLDQLLVAPETQVVRPGPLSADAVAELLAALLGEAPEPAFTAACHQATAGNPLLLRALVDSLARDRVAPTAANTHRVTQLGPAAVSRIVSVRLAGADPPARRLAEALAVLGGSGPLALAGALAGLRPVPAAEAAARLTGLLDVDGDQLAFAHPVVASATYAQLGPAERAEGHARAAAALRRTGAAPERVAAHLLAVPPGADGQLVADLRRAAAVARERGAPEEAFAFLSRALEENPAEGTDGATRLRLLTEAGAVALQVDLAAAAAILAEARSHAPDADVLTQLGAAYGFLRDPGSAVAAFAEALALVGDSDPDRRRRLEATLLVAVLIVPGRLDLRDRLPELVALPGHDSVGGRMLDAAVAAQQMAMGDPGAVPRARRALADGRLVHEANGEGPLVCGWLTLLAADDPLALDSLEAAVRQAHLHGSTRALAAALCFRAVGRLWTGQLADAEQDAREALGLARSGRVDMDVAFAGAYLAEALREAGQLAEADEVLSGLGTPGPGPAYYALDALASVRLAQGRYPEAAETAREAGRAWARYGFTNPAVGAWRGTAALALQALGRTEEARLLAAEELAAARAWGAPRALGRALRITGQLTGLDPLAEAVAVLDGTPARLERAHARAAYGAALRRRGQRTQARDLLAAALDEAEAAGAVPLVEAVRAELRTAGFRPRRTRLTGVDALTASERRVAELAAGGSSNRDIAQSLFVTTKTVEVHLSSAYRKLGVGRAGLAAALSPSPK